MDYLPILAGIQPAELRRRGATLSLANRATLNPDHILHEQLVGKQNAHQGRLKSRRPFVPAAQKLLDSLTESDIRPAQWMDYVWNMEYLKSASRLHAFIPKASPKPLGMGLPRTSWVKLNRLPTGVGRFHSSTYKWGAAPSPICECGASEQTADHIISTYIVHQKEYKICWSWMMTPDAGLKSTPSTSKLSEEDAQPHDDDERFKHQNIPTIFYKKTNISECWSLRPECFDLKLLF